MKWNGDNILSWGGGGGMYQSFASSLIQHLWETFKFHTFSWLKPCSCPKVSLQYKLHDVAVWSRYANSPICQVHTHVHTHAHIQVSGSLISACCTLSSKPLWWWHCILLLTIACSWKRPGWHGYRCTCTCTCTHTQLHVKACCCWGFGASRAWSDLVRDAIKGAFFLL